MSNYAGRHIQHSRWVGGSRRQCAAVGVGGKPSIRPTIGRNQSGMTDDIDMMHRQKSSSSTAFAPGTNAAQVKGPPYGHHADPMFSNSIDSDIHSFFPNDLSVAGASVYGHQGAIIDGDLSVLIGDEFAGFYRGDITGEHANTMTVVTGQICLD